MLPGGTKLFGDTDCADTDCTSDPLCSDGDNDGTPDSSDNCLNQPNNQSDTEGNGLGDACGDGENNGGAGGGTGGPKTPVTNPKNLNGGGLGCQLSALTPGTTGFQYLLLGWSGFGLFALRIRRRALGTGQVYFYSPTKLKSGF